jgi:hypothetical protein
MLINNDSKIENISSENKKIIIEDNRYKKLIDDWYNNNIQKLKGKNLTAQQLCNLISYTKKSPIYLFILIFTIQILK